MMCEWFGSVTLLCLRLGFEAKASHQEVRMW